MKQIVENLLQMLALLTISNPSNKEGVNKYNRPNTS